MSDPNPATKRPSLHGTPPKLTVQKATPAQVQLVLWRWVKYSETAIEKDVHPCTIGGIVAIASDLLRCQHDLDAVRKLGVILECDANDPKGCIAKAEDIVKSALAERPPAVA